MLIDFLFVFSHVYTQLVLDSPFVSSLIVQQINFLVLRNFVEKLLGSQEWYLIFVSFLRISTDMRYICEITFTVI
jgi:hypothetical protein